jgi:hypothetical protein
MTKEDNLKVNQQMHLPLCWSKPMPKPRSTIGLAFGGPKISI